MGKEVKFLEKPDQEKWLKQRGWTPVVRENKVGKNVITGKAVMNRMTFWRCPDTGIQYNFQAALRKAQEACRLPADYELTPGTGT